MPFKSSLSFKKLGLVILPAKRTCLQLFTFRIFIIFPIWPIETELNFLSFLKDLFFVKSIIKYFFLYYGFFLGFLLGNSFLQILIRSFYYWFNGVQIALFLSFAMKLITSSTSSLSLNSSFILLRFSYSFFDENISL